MMNICIDISGFLFVESIGFSFISKLFIQNDKTIPIAIYNHCTQHRWCGYIKPFSKTRSRSIYLNHLLPFLPFFICATPCLTLVSLFFPPFLAPFSFFFQLTNSHFRHSFIQKIH